MNEESARLVHAYCLGFPPSKELVIDLALVAAVGIGLLLCARLVRGRRTSNGPIEIHAVVLEVSPKDGVEGAGRVFTAVVTAIGSSLDAAPRDYAVELIDDEAREARLVQFESASCSSRGIRPFRPDDRCTRFTWTTVDTFTLTCEGLEADDPVPSRGALVGQAEIYARLTIAADRAARVMESAPVLVRCADPADSR